MKNNLIRSLAIGAVLLGTGNALAITTDDTPTADDLVSTMLGPGITADNVTLTCAGGASGTFGDGEGAVGIEDGIILSSGNIANVIGPNNQTDITANNGTPGDTDLEALAGQNTHDACVLEFDFQLIPVSGLISASVAFNYVFSSDEYNEFVGSINDVFAFFVDGENIALIPETETAVSIASVNQMENSQFYINNDDCQSNPAACPVPGTQMDGLTMVLPTAEVEIFSDQSYHIKIAIADASDSILDSNVFIEAGSLTIVSNLPPVALCQDVTIFLDSNGEAVLTPEQVSDGSYDPEDDSINSIVSPDQFTCSDIGDHTVTLTVTDEYGLNDTCEATVTVVDVDSDNDGVSNCADLCPETASNAYGINADGCSAGQLADLDCQCDDNWRRQSDYQRCITRAARKYFPGNTPAVRQAKKSYINSRIDNDCGN
ncbi:MAG: hypothetical protein D3925_15410 [Candidatus Electrothrix sp. AR5]|nr:hypothetical protein [Candidatus Electrothrix sp. AR5]